MGKYLTSLETDFISSAIDPAKSNVIVDVGAEAGRFSLLAANRKVAVISIAIDSYSLKRLKQKSTDVIVIQADARKTPLKDVLWTTVFVIEVLDYIPQLEEALSECLRILKPASSLILSFGNQSSLKAKLRGLRGKTYLHSYSNVMQCLLKLGFKIEAKKGYTWLPFGRMSQSRLVPFLGGLEKILGLRRISSLSPWLSCMPQSQAKWF